MEEIRKCTNLRLYFAQPLDRFEEILPSIWIGLLPRASDCVQSHQDDNDLLTHGVMQVPSQATPLFILQFEDASAQRIHRILRQPERVLRIYEVGNVGSRDSDARRHVQKRRKANPYCSKAIVGTWNSNLTFRRFEGALRHRFLKGRPGGCRDE